MEERAGVEAETHDGEGQGAGTDVCRGEQEGRSSKTAFVITLGTHSRHAPQTW